MPSAARAAGSAARISSCRRPKAGGDLQSQRRGDPTRPPDDRRLAAMCRPGRTESSGWPKWSLGRSSTVRSPANGGHPAAAAFGAALVARRIDGLVQRTEPAIALLIAHRGNHQQIARACGRHVGHAHAFGELAGVLVLFVLEQFPGRRAQQTRGAQSRHRRSARLRAPPGWRSCRPGSRPEIPGPWRSAPSSGARRRRLLRAPALRWIRPSRACAASSSTKPRKERPPVSSKVRARSQMRYTFASACAPARRSVNPACARVASSSALMVSATGRGVALAMQIRQDGERVRQSARSPARQIVRHAGGTDAGGPLRSGSAAADCPGWRRAIRAACRTPKAHRPATRWRPAPRARSPPPRDGRTISIRPAGAGCRALRAPACNRATGPSP